MKLLIAVLCASLTFAGAVPASAAGQTLSIAVTGDAAQATRLPRYDPRDPIAIAVSDPAAKAGRALTLLAAGPAGELLRVPLARGANSTFDGTLFLPDAGTWRVQLVSQDARLRTGTTPISLDVALPERSDAWLIGLAVGGGLFIIVGGGGFALLRRLTRTQAPAELKAAA